VSQAVLALSDMYVLERKESKMSGQFSQAVLTLSDIYALERKESKVSGQFLLLEVRLAV
jgi:hypothetical protein